MVGQSVLVDWLLAELLAGGCMNDWLSSWMVLNHV